MRKFRESLKEKLKNEEFRKEYEELEGEFTKIRQEIDAKPRDSFMVRSKKPKQEVRIAL